MKDLLIGIFTLVLSAFVYFYSYTFSRTGGGLVDNPAYYPQVLAFIMALLSIALIVKSIPKAGEREKIFESSALFNIGKIAALLISYILLMGILGFAVSSLLFVFCGIILFGGKVSTSAIFTLPITGAIYLLFAVLFKMPLPSGIFF